MKKKMFFTILLFINFSAYSEGKMPNYISCKFDGFIQTKHLKDFVGGYVEIQQILEINDGKTTHETLKLDGQKRATNSDNWTPVTNKNFGETWESKFLGDFGEMLSIEHDLGENLKKLNGIYKSTLIDSVNQETDTRMGQCFVKSK